MNEAQEKLREALQDYLESGDPAQVDRLLKLHPELISEAHGDYPDFHRVLDLSVSGRALRVCRWVSKGEELSLLPIAQADESAEGVPLWLTGRRLRDWLDHETDSPEDGPTDWDRYR